MVSTSYDSFTHHGHQKHRTIKHLNSDGITLTDTHSQQTNREPIIKAFQRGKIWFHRTKNIKMKQSSFGFHPLKNLWDAGS